MQEQERLIVVQEACIKCGLCVMQGFADKVEGKVEIKADLPQKERTLAEACCPVGAICQWTINN